jgi:hypothetical protein
MTPRFHTERRWRGGCDPFRWRHHASFMRRSKHIIFFLTTVLAAFVTVRFWAFLSSEEVKRFVETLAVLVGGGWALYRFVLRRESKPALDVGLTYQAIPEKEGRFLAFFDVTLTNKSTCQVMARIRKIGQPAFSDRSEVLQHSCSLLLRRVNEGLAHEGQVRWFPDANAKSPLASDIVANLLDEYEDEAEGIPDFWMEPSESYHLCVGVILQPGVYLAMVTFVGEQSDDEFWRRLFIIQIRSKAQCHT